MNIWLLRVLQKIWRNCSPGNELYHYLLMPFQTVEVKTCKPQEFIHMTFICGHILLMNSLNFSQIVAMLLFLICFLIFIFSFPCFNLANTVYLKWGDELMSHKNKFLICGHNIISHLISCMRLLRKFVWGKGRKKKLPFFPYSSWHKLMRDMAVTHQADLKELAATEANCVSALCQLRLGQKAALEHNAKTAN